MKRIISLFILGTVLLIPAFAQIDLQPAATVNLIRTEAITVRQLRTQVETLERQAGRAFTAAERRQVLDVMINEKLVLQAAERDRITVSDGEVNQQLQELRTQLAQNIGRQPTDAEFAQAVRNEFGMELPAFREEMRKQLIFQKYIMAKKQADIQNIRVPTEADIANYYNLTRTQFVRPDTVRVTMIEVGFTDVASKARARVVADRLVREIGNNAARFDEAVQRGMASGGDYNAGDAGYLPRNLEAQQNMGQEFMTVAFALRQGDISGLLEGPRGFYIIKITETYAQKNLELSDIFQLGAPYTVRDFIGNALLEQNQQEVLDRITQELLTELRRGNPFQIFENNLNW
ncbi:MAG: peptidyl-prolyl cis-trans isomerase [Treponema sp.]|nr:peptidyl-prolyl cis-trans isomerase [Treponema sp.]